MHSIIIGPWLLNVAEHAKRVGVAALVALVLVGVAASEASAGHECGPYWAPSEACRMQ